MLPTTQQPRKGFIDGGISRRHASESLFVTDRELREIPRGELDRITRFVPAHTECATIEIFEHRGPFPEGRYEVRIAATVPIITMLPVEPTPPDWLGGATEARTFFDTGRFSVPSFNMPTGAFYIPGNF